MDLLHVAHAPTHPRGLHPLDAFGLCRRADDVRGKDDQQLVPRGRRAVVLEEIAEERDVRQERNAVVDLREALGDQVRRAGWFRRQPR